jgi:phosphorylcholine metabolism protein LicD
LQGFLLNLKDVKAIAGELDIQIILDGGSLLGAFRDNGPIQGDEDDIDFAVPYSVAQFKMKEVIEKFVARGFVLYRLRDTVITFERDGVKVDLLIYKHDWTDLRYYLTLYHNKKPFALYVPEHYWNKLGTINFMGEEFACPEDTAGYLTWRFDNWKEPILRPEFSFENYIQKEGLTEWLR